MYYKIKHTPSDSPPGFLSKRNKRLVHECSQQLGSQEPETGNSPKVHQQVNEQTHYGILLFKTELGKEIEENKQEEINCVTTE